jgi:hypothetical protein
MLCRHCYSITDCVVNKTATVGLLGKAGVGKKNNFEIALNKVGVLAEAKVVVVNVHILDIKRKLGNLGKTLLLIYGK